MEPILVEGEAELSDGDPGFEALSDHGSALVLALLRRERERSWYSGHDHAGGVREGYFIVGLELAGGCVRYDLAWKYWWYVKQTGARYLSHGKAWDGATREEMWERLLRDAMGVRGTR